MANTKIPSELIDGTLGVAGISSSADATAITIDSSERVSIGHTTANADFQVSNAGAEQLEFFAGNASNVNTIQHYNRSTSSYIENRSIANNHTWYNGATEVARVHTDGKFGIGTNAPNALLTVNGGTNDFEPSSSGTGLFHVRGGASSLYTAYIGVSDNGVQFGHTGNNRYLRFDTNETERMRILSDGKVGISSTAPTRALEINDTANVDGEQLVLKGDASYGGTMLFKRGDSYTWRAGVGGGSSTNSTILQSFFGIEYGNTLAFTIAHTTGRVGIGEDDPDNQLHVVAGGTHLYPYRSANGQGYYYHGHGNGSYHHNVQAGASVGFYFNSAAYANGGFHTYSDERLKENITNIDSALDKVALMNGVTFDWKDQELRGNGKQFGVIAQDMLKVDKELPDLVEDAEATQEEIDNKELNTQYYSMDYSRITPYLIEAIKELKTKLEAAEARITELER